MRAVNLIPNEARRGSGSSSRSGGAVYVLLGVLAVAVVLVTVYVLASNRISDQKAQIGALQAQASQAQGAAARLAPYVEFAKLAQARAATIRQIATSRFDWQAALGGLSRVVPANTSLQSLAGAVAGATPGGSATSAAASALTGNSAGPSVALTGCSDTHDDVARLMSRLRLVNGVTEVTLQSSTKGGGAQSGASVSSAGGGGGCPVGSPSFALNIAFAAPASGVTAAASPQAVSSTPGTTAPTTTTTGGTK
jgi:Tfp pilus assembly protein PilN